MDPKILVFGSTDGQIEAAFTKIASLHKKNQFAFVIIAGNLFAEAEDDGAVTKLLNGEFSLPVPTYFTVTNRALPERIIERIIKEEDVCENLHYLNKRSVTKTSEGIRIVTLGGVLDPEIVAGQSKEQHLPYHTLDDAKSLKGANTTDILLTATWPSQIWNGSRVALDQEPSSIPNSDAIADLVKTLRPRYHFTTSPSQFFYEREPFSHPLKDQSDSTPDVTRFISLPSFANSAKAKAIYAFALSSRDSSVSVPTGCTASPFPQAMSKKRSPPDVEAYSRFGQHHDDLGHHRRKKGRRDRSPPPGPDRCFFCLSNPNLPTHMISSVGEDAYLAAAKGPLSLLTTYEAEGLRFPGHMIIVPLTHAPTISTRDMAESTQSTFKEMSRFRAALQAMVSTVTKRKLGAVTWEISRARNIHTHWQFFPVPSHMVKKGLVEAAFRVEAENMKLPKLEVEDFGSADEIEGDYFRLWIWAEEEPEDVGETPEDGGGRIIGNSLLMRFDENVRFDLQYGRKVMAKLMGLQKRVIWQDCVQTEEEETADVTAFRDSFKPWDFTLG